MLAKELKQPVLLWFLPFFGLVFRLSPLSQKKPVLPCFGVKMYFKDSTPRQHNLRPVRDAGDLEHGMIKAGIRSPVKPPVKSRANGSKFYRKSRQRAVSLGCLAREYTDGIPVKPLEDAINRPRRLQNPSGVFCKRERPVIGKPQGGR